jgi:predicted membrane chloride channel (bestrophin family)
MTFFVVFYNGHVFARSNRLYELTKNMNEFCLYAASIFSREIADKNMVRKLARLLIASAFLFFFERTEADSNGNISEAEWGQIARLGLLTKREIKSLKVHNKRLGAHASMPSFMLLHWSMKLYRAKSSRLNELEKTYWNIRRCQDDVVELMELPMPFQYFHIMNLMLALNLTLWSYSLALESSYFASVIFMFVQLVFQGIRELSVALSDPYGDDEADFPINEWMTQLYVRICAVTEDQYDGKLEAQMLQNIEPLKEIQPGTQVIDLLVDRAGKRSPRTSAGKSGETSSSSDPETELPPQMQAQGYSKLPQQEEELQEEEEDDDDD